MNTTYTQIHLYLLTFHDAYTNQTETKYADLYVRYNKETSQMLNHHQEALREVREDRNFIQEVGCFHSLAFM